MLGKIEEEHWVVQLQTSTGIVFEVDKETILPNGEKLKVIRISESKTKNRYIITAQKGLPPCHLLVYNPAYVLFDSCISMG